MRSNNKGLLLAVGAGLLLSSCMGEKDKGATPTRQRPAPPSRQVVDHPVKIGPPYTVGGRTYTPEDAISYDEVGYATWYGDEAAGATTANGEPFVPSGVTAAHKTLPLPSYVEVTALETGRTILVRVNDRGPFTDNRIIDLSRGAAEQLGVAGSAVAVRVRRVNPPEQERAALRAHGRASGRLETPAPLLAVLRQRLTDRSMPVTTPSQAESPRPVSAPPLAKAGPAASPSPSPGGFVVEQSSSRSAPLNPAASGGGYVVQVAAFSSRDRAMRLARSIGASAVESRGVWRVRLGPYPSQDAAQAGVQAAKAEGYRDARIMVAD